MKKILSFALAIVMLLSVLVMTACDKEPVVADITTPGSTYELNLSNINYYIRTIGNPYGEGKTYISKLDTYGYTDAGFSLSIFCNYIYPAELNDVKITYEVTYLYDSQLSFDTVDSVALDPVTVTVELNKTGTTIYNYAESIEEAMKNNTYCKYALNPKPASVDIKSVSGSITFLPR